jgi:hypothetical protein
MNDQQVSGMHTNLATIELSDHAVHRWHERVKPGLSAEAAERELLAVVEHGRLTHERPVWYPEPEPSLKISGEAYLLLGPDILLPCVQMDGKHAPWLATSCITRGSLPEETRQSRNETARRRRVRARRRGSSSNARHEAREAKRRGEKREREVEEGWEGPVSSEASGEAIAA